MGHRVELKTSTTSCTMCLSIQVPRRHFTTGPMVLRKSSMLNSQTWLSTVTEMLAPVEFASWAIGTRASDNRPAHVDCCVSHVKYSRQASSPGFVSRPGLAADTNKVSRWRTCSCHLKVTCACPCCGTWYCVFHMQYSRQPSCPGFVSRPGLAADTNKVSKWRTCAGVWHVKMTCVLEPSRDGKPCVFTASACLEHS